MSADIAYLIENGHAGDASVNNNFSAPSDNEPHSRPQSEIVELSEDTEVVDIVKYNQQCAEDEKEEADQRRQRSIEKMEFYLRMLELEQRRQQNQNEYHSLTPRNERRSELINPYDGKLGYVCAALETPRFS